MGQFLYRLGQAGSKMLLAAFFDFRAYGVQNVPPAGGVLVAANHQSYLDPLLVGAPIFRPVDFMARRGLFAAPLLGGLIRAVGAFPVDREGGGSAGFREALRRLRAGRLVAVFPEGTRSTDGRLGALRPGLGFLVERAGVPVVPAVVHGAFRAWPRQRRFCRPWPLAVAFGAPLTASAGGPAALVRELGSRMCALQADLRRYCGNLSE